MLKPWERQQQLFWVMWLQPRSIRSRNFEQMNSSAKLLTGGSLQELEDDLPALYPRKFPLRPIFWIVIDSEMHLAIWQPRTPLSILLFSCKDSIYACFGKKLQNASAVSLKYGDQPIRLPDRSNTSSAKLFSSNFSITCLAPLSPNMLSSRYSSFSDFICCSIFDRCNPPYTPKVFFEKFRILIVAHMCSNESMIVMLQFGCRPLFLNITARTGNAYRFTASETAFTAGSLFKNQFVKSIEGFSASFISRPAFG